MKRIIIANSNNCRIYDYKKPDDLTLIKEINVPENKLKSSELGADRPGRYSTGGTARGAYSPESDIQDVHIDNFARELAVELDHARNKHEYDNLVVIMPSHMDGLLTQHLNPHVKGLITRTIQKNMVHLSEHEVLDYLNNNL